MRVGKRLDPVIEHMDEFIRRPAAFPRPFCYRGYAREHVFYAVVQLGDQKALVVLRFSPFGHVYLDTSQSLRTTRIVIGNGASRLNPPDLTARPNNAKLADELGSPFLERTNVFATEALHIATMDARVPLLGGDC